MTNPFWLETLNNARKKMLGQSPVDPADAQTEDDEDEWSDVASSEGYPSPERRRNGDGAVDCRHGDHYTLMEDSMTEYLPYMPSLLSKDLPPCGLHVQVAYENTNRMIRHRWLYFKGEKSVSEICRSIKEDLSNQSILWPPFSLIGRKQRTPWRRELTFQYELRWIKYFIRASQMTQPMTESELLDHGKESGVPPELGIQCREKYVLDLWEAWHKKKRAISPTIPGTADAGQDVAQSVTGEATDFNTSLISMVVPSPPTANSKEHRPLELRTRSFKWAQTWHI